MTASGGQFPQPLGFLGSSISSKKRTKRSRIVVKTNSFVRFLEEMDDPKNHFEINLPLKVLYNFKFSVFLKFWSKNLL